MCLSDSQRTSSHLLCCRAGRVRPLLPREAGGGADLRLSGHRPAQTTRDPVQPRPRRRRPGVVTLESGSRFARRLHSIFFFFWSILRIHNTALQLHKLIKFVNKYIFKESLHRFVTSFFQYYKPNFGQLWNLINSVTCTGCKRCKSQMTYLPRACQPSFQT